jgi:hypothetical protein
MIYSKLADLRNVFLEQNTQALQGKAIIDNYLKKEKNLFYLLRHHSQKEINENETYLRDDIDYFLEYFSILALAHITGYLALGDLKADKSEIIYYLNLPPLKKYYYDHYPLLLPQTLLETMEQDRAFVGERSENTAKNEELFHQFHALNQSIDNEEVNQFLWFLDNGYTDGYGLHDLKRVLGNTERCFKYRSHKNALGQAIRGFFLYLDFIQQFDLFLKKPKDKLDKSAYWIYHEYWLSRIEEKLHSSLNKFFNGMQEYLAKTDVIDEHNPQERVAASRKVYDDIVERIVYTSGYQSLFTKYLNKWRKNSHEQTL